MALAPAGFPSEHLPTEIIFKVGESLDGPGLYAALRLSRTWKAALSPLIWDQLTALQQLFPNDVPSDNDDLPLGRFSNILHMAQRVQHLTIWNRNDEQLENLFLVIQGLGHLEVLDLDLISCFPRFTLAPLFNVFSRLKGLSLRGHWYEMGDHAEEEQGEALEQWPIQRLTVYREHMGLIRHCGNLEHLQLLQLVPFFTVGPIPSLRLLSHCPRLKELQLPPQSTEQQMIGLEEALLTLTSLEKLLSFRLDWPEQAELLNTGKRQPPVVGFLQGQQAGQQPQVEGLNDEFALPAMKTLEVSTMNLTVQKETRFVSRLLQQRPLLEILLLPHQNAISVDAVISKSWACLSLTELRISLTGPSSAGVEGLETWRSFYKQIGKLTKLLTLHIFCPEMEKSPNDGIMSMQGATSLKRLTIVDLLGDWSQQEVVNLMTAVPRLEYLKLTPLSPLRHQQVFLWLEEIGKSHILVALF
ncbi:hypothetical protein BGX33_001630 [Mortierella sp. NVP41]|nr:hypothetical protein BGX33_001630 [Mortierella sp. NVP41]